MSKALSEIMEVSKRGGAPLLKISITISHRR